MTTTMELMPATELTDQFEVLKCMVANLSQRTGRKPFVVGFTSCEVCEGVTSVAVNFTAALIRDHHPRVLLVDGNMNKPALHRYFSLSAGREAEEQAEKRAAKRPTAGRHGARDWQILQANPNLDVILAEAVTSQDARLTKITE